MGQLESPANLDRISDPRIRLLVEVLIRTGLRIGDATRLALDCLDHGGEFVVDGHHRVAAHLMVAVADRKSVV